MVTQDPRNPRASKYQPYFAGPKRYGGGLRDAPTVGPVDKMGYRERDAKVKARQRAIRKRLQSMKKGKGSYITPQPEPFKGLERRI